MCEKGWTATNRTRPNYQQEEIYLKLLGGLIITGSNHQRLAHSFKKEEEYGLFIVAKIQLRSGWTVVDSIESF